MLNFIPMSSIYIFGTLLTANGSLKILNMIALGGMLLNIGLTLFMIPKYGALGATFATLITQLFAALLHIAAAQNEFKLRYSVKDLIRVVLFTVFCFSLIWLSTQLSINWLINFSIGLLLSTGTMLAAGFIPLKQALSLLKNKVAS